jgi:type I restriction enzyme S subunit
MVRFGDVVRSVNEAERAPLAAGLQRYIGLEHIEPANLHLREWGNLADDEVSFTKRFRRGQVLFGKRRAYQRKVAVAEFDGICSSDILTFEPKSGDLLPELLPFIVQSDGFFDHALGTSSGSLSPRTRWSQLADFRFPLPPKQEQSRIADILWAADCVIERQRDFSKALAHGGKVLTAHFVNNGISASPDEGNVDQRLPSGWSLCRLPTLVRQDAPITYGIVQPGNFDNEGVLMVLGGDFINGWVDKSKMFRVAPSLHRQYWRSRLSTGDVIMCIVGVTTGAVAIVPNWGEDANLTQTSARISCDSKKILPEFLVAYFRSASGRAFVKKFLKGSRQVRLNIGDFDNCLVPTPSLEEQKQIVGRLALIEAAKSRQKEMLASQCQLARALGRELLQGKRHVH